MGRKREAIFMGIGILAGLALSGPASAAVQQLTAVPTSQTFYVDGQRVQFEAYEIHGNNFVKLRDIGKSVDFGVTYDGTTNTVHIAPGSPYIEEVTAPAQTIQPTPSPSGLEEEAIHATLLGLRDVYPTNTPYGAPYVPNNPLDRPYSNCDACAGWAMKCSDTAFGTLPWRRVMNPRWEDIRIGDLLDYRTGSTGHVVVVLEKRDDMVIVTESGRNGRVRWGGQYPRWWLEQQSEYSLRTRYPD